MLDQSVNQLGENQLISHGSKISIYIISIVNNKKITKINLTTNMEKYCLNYVAPLYSVQL